jgi:hypothetical protein
VALNQEVAARLAGIEQQLEPAHLGQQVGRPDELDSAGDAVAIGIGGVGEREERRIVNRLEKTQAGHAWRGELGDSGGTGGDHFGEVGENRPMLKLGASLGPHRVEPSVHHPAEAGQVENRMTLPVADVATGAGGGDENRAEAIGAGKHPAEFRVAGEERGPLRAGEPVQRAFENLLRVGSVGEHQIASPRQDRKGQDKPARPLTGDRRPSVGHTTHSRNTPTRSQELSPMITTATNQASAVSSRPFANSPIFPFSLVNRTSGTTAKES